MSRTGRRDWTALRPGRIVRVPRTEADCHELIELLDHLTDEVGEDENHPLASLMEVLGVLVEKFEDEHVPKLES